MNPNERIRMWHPDLPHTRDEPPVVTRRAFDVVWSRQDPPWQEWTPDVASPPERPPKTGPNSGRAAWAAYAEAIGVEFAPDTSKKELIELVEAKET